MRALLARETKLQSSLVSYSLLHDHFYNHMTEAGFTGFERGERGSTAEHLEVSEFKAKKEMERVAAMEAEVDTMRSTAANLENEVTKKQKQLDGLEKKTATAKKEVATVEDVENMMRPIVFSNYLQLSSEDWGKVSNLAKEGVKSRATIKEQKKKISGLENTIKELKQKLMKYEGMGITDKLLYIEAMRKAPKRLMDTIADIKRQPAEKKESMQSTPEQKRNTDISL
jgi:septal ring factor EnvC (AmiA/AmiB activator)